MDGDDGDDVDVMEGDDDDETIQGTDDEVESDEAEVTIPPKVLRNGKVVGESEVEYDADVQRLSVHGLALQLNDEVTVSWSFAGP